MLSMREKVIAMAMTLDGQRSSYRSDVEKIGQCAKEEVSSSLLGKLALPFLCYKRIPSYIVETRPYFPLNSFT